MERVDLVIKGTIAAVSTVVSAMVGGIGLALTVLLGLMAIDVLTGTMAGWKGEGVSSSTGIKGLFRKVYILLLIGAIYLLGQVVEVAEFAADGAAVAFAVMEFLSIVENGGRLGVSLPKFVTNGIKVLKGE